MIWVLKNPDPDTRARISEDEESPGQDWERMSRESFQQWLDSQPVPPPPPPPVEPDFRAMAEALRTENGFKDAFLEAQPLEPMAVGSLTSRFDDFSKDGDFAPFLQSMLLVLNALPAQKAAHIGMEFLAVAHRCHMPPAFLDALQSAFGAE